MKQSIQLFLFSTFIFISSVSVAAEYNASGQVSIFRSHIDSVYTDWFSIKGFSNAGSCTDYLGNAIIIIGDSERSKRHISIVMSAAMSGKVINATINDDQKDPNGHCYLQYVTVTN